MSEEKTLGELLRQARDGRGESLEQVHERTGIGARVLASLEEGSGGVVEPVYQRLALTSYGEYLGLATDELLSLYDADHGTQPVAEVREPAPPPPARWRSDLGRRLGQASPMWLGAALAIVLVAVILLIVYLRGGEAARPAAATTSAPSQVQTPPRRQQPPPATAVRAPALADESPTPVASETPTRAPAAAETPAEALAAETGSAQAQTPPAQTPPAQASSNQTTAAQPPATSSAAATASPETSQTAPPATEDAPAQAPAPSVGRRGDLEALAAGTAVVIEGEAVDSTWIQVQWDGRGTSEEIVPRGQRRIWAARDSILVRAGRAHGIRFSYGGQLLGGGRLGDATRVLRFRATRDGVVLLGPDLEPLTRLVSNPGDAATRSDTSGP